MNAEAAPGISSPSATCCGRVGSPVRGTWWGEYLHWWEQRVVVMDRVLRPIVKALP